MEQIVLASASQRRRELLDSIMLPYLVIRSDIDESLIRGDSPQETAELLARKKTETVAAMPQAKAHRFVLGADTLIDLDGQIIEKPSSKREAKDILESFSAREHLVISALCVYDRKSGLYTSNSDITRVRFKNLSSEEITWYLDTGEWDGVAGGYRIQGRAACLIDHIEGSASGVVGLPLHVFYGILSSNGYQFGNP